MQFQSHADQLDLYSDCLWWCGLDPADTTSFPIKDFTRAANFALDRVNVLIVKADGNWKHDDTNQSTETFDVTTNLVSGTKKYAIPVTWLKIGDPIRVKDNNGNWKEIKHKTRDRLSDDELIATGVPTTYHRQGNYLYLCPTPNYSSSGGLEVPFQRGPSYFAYTDTTKTPGFATTLHRLISLYPALDYCDINTLEKRAAKIAAKIAAMEVDLVDHYANRNMDEVPSLNIERDDYGQVALSEGNSNPQGIM